MHMPPPTLDPQRATVIPVRECSKCGAVDDVFHLTMVNHVWLCQPCHGSLAFPGTQIPGEDVECDSDPELQRLADEAEFLRRADAALRWAKAAFRVVAYGALLLLAWKYPVFDSILLGLFIADAISWVAMAWFDARFHWHAVTAEAVLYTVLFVVLQWCGVFDLPDDRVARVLAGSSAAGLFCLRGMVFWHKLKL